MALISPGERSVLLDDLIFRMVSGLEAAASPPPTPVPSPYQVFIPAVGAPSPAASGTPASRLPFLESPWLYLAFGVLVGAWLALRALERRGKTGR